MTRRTTHLDPGPLVAAALATIVLLLGGCITAPQGNQTTDGNHTVDPGNANDDMPPPPGTPNPLAIDTLDQGSYPQGPGAPEDRIIVDNDTLATFWEEHHQRKGGRGPPPAPPQIDFQAEFVLFAYGGEQLSGGHEIVIRDVYKSNHRHTANVYDREPGEDCPTTDVLTYPFHLVTVADTLDTDVRFHHRSETYSC